MFSLEELEHELLELKLKKRELILAGKNTYTLDKEIEMLEEKIKLNKNH